MTNKDMLTVILAAGHSKRFSEEGWPKHKVLLPMPDNRVLLEWIFDSIPSSDVLFVALSEQNRSLFPKLYIAMHANKDVKEVRQWWLKKTRTGPLATAWAVRSFLDYDREILIMYCDVITPAGFIEEFASYMRESKNNAGVIGTDYPGDRLTRIPNSTFADGGIYWFRSGKDFVEAAENKSKGKEDGIPSIVHSIDPWGIYEAQDVIDLGIPRDYFNWCAEQGAFMDKKTWRPLRKTEK